jgi:hypothetical protein
MGIIAATGNRSAGLRGRGERGYEVGWAADLEVAPRPNLLSDRNVRALEAVSLPLSTRASAGDREVPRPTTPVLRATKVGSPERPSTRSRGPRVDGVISRQAGMTPPRTQTHRSRVAPACMTVVRSGSLRFYEQGEFHVPRDGHDLLAGEGGGGGAGAADKKLTLNGAAPVALISRPPIDLWARLELEATEEAEGP